MIYLQNDNLPAYDMHANKISIFLTNNVDKEKIWKYNENNKGKDPEAAARQPQELANPAGLSGVLRREAFSDV